jgi:23S rRNA (cytosine1962-C5)-methyltransferase
MKTITLRPGKERSLLKGHPWVFDTSIAKGSADAGETVRVHSSEGAFLAWASFSPSSKIRARVWSFDEATRIDEGWMDTLVERAIAMRDRLEWASSGVRLVHAESDGLPGLIVDRYNDTLVLQISSTGVERFKGAIVRSLIKHTGLSKIFERSDTSSRKQEGLEPRLGWLQWSDLQSLAAPGVLAKADPNALSPMALQPGPGAEALSTRLTIQEHDWQLCLDIEAGHKTGFYLDQRDSRATLGRYVASLGLSRVLNCYAYTGGFTVAALHGMKASGALAQGGHVTSVDSSAPSLEMGRHNTKINGFDEASTTWRVADVNASLRQFLEQGEQFDAIVLDPPKFAPTSVHVERAARAYKDINRLALKLLAPGGVLLTFSCSGGVSPELFHQIVASAGADAQVDGFILERLQGASDHPMTLNFPQGDYLKGLVVMKK